MPGPIQPPTLRRGTNLRFYWVGLTVITVVSVLWFFVALFGASGEVNVVFFLCWLLLTGPYVLLYRSAVTKGGRAYDDMSSWKHHVRVDEGKCFVPPEHMPRIASFLTEAIGTRLQENRIYRAWRRHVFDLWRRIFLWVALAVLFLAASIAVAVIRHRDYEPGFHIGLPKIPAMSSLFPKPTPTHAHHPVSPTSPRSHHAVPPSPHPRVSTVPPASPSSSAKPWVIPWWIFPLLLLMLSIAMAIVAWVRSWKWQYRYVIITNLMVSILTAPPKWLLPLLASKQEGVDLVRIITTHIDKEDLGHNFDLGTLGLDSEANYDVDFNSLPWVPHPREARTDLESARLMAQNNVRTDPEHAYQMRMPWGQPPSQGNGPDTQEIPPVR